MTFTVSLAVWCVLHVSLLLVNFNVFYRTARQKLNKPHTLSPIGSAVSYFVSREAVGHRVNTVLITTDHRILYMFCTLPVLEIPIWSFLYLLELIHVFLTKLNSIYFLLFTNQA